MMISTQTNLLRRCIAQPQRTRGFLAIINQAEVAYREFLGSNRVELTPGLRWDLPFFHQTTRVSMKEQLCELENQDAYTKDNVPVILSGTVFYKVSDAEKVCFSIDNAKQAIKSVSESGFRAVVGRFDYDEIISNRNSINAEMLTMIGQTTSEWGINTTRLEIQNFGPQNTHIAEQLEKQMQAERARRENELQAQTNIRTAEARKRIMTLDSEGELIANKNRSDAMKYDLEMNSDGLSKQIESLSATFDGDMDKASHYLLEMKRLEHLQALAGTSNKVYFIPPDGMFPATKVIGDLLTENKLS